MSGIRAKLMRMVTIIFPQTGNRYSGASATEALALLAKTQWTDDARQDIKRALAWRHFVWTGGSDPLAVSEFMPDDEFIDALAAAGVIKVERTPSDNTK